MVKKTVTKGVSKRPRLVGALFTASLLLMAAGNVVANGGSATNGP